MEQKLIKLITSLRNVIKAEELNISDNTLFSEACSFLRGEFAGQNRFPKHLIPESLTPQPTAPYVQRTTQKPLNSPTDKQLGLLRKNITRLTQQGIQIEDIKTKLEASKIIDSLMNG